MDKVIKVELLNQGIGLTDILVIFSTILSIASALYVFWEKHSQNKNRKMNLIVTPVAFASNYKDDLLFIKFIFTNESSLPISITFLQITLQNINIPSTPNGDGGSSSFIEHNVVSLTTDGVGVDVSRPRIENLNTTSAKIPITILPYESRGEFIAFHVDKFDYQPVIYRGFTLEVTTSKGMWKNDIRPLTGNFSEFSYAKDHIFGKAVIESTRKEKVAQKIKVLLKRNKRK